MSKHVLSNLQKAETAIAALIGMGIEVSHADVSETVPRIHLRGDDRALRARFGGGIHVRRPASNRGGIETIIAARFEGCQLHWRAQQ